MATPILPRVQSAIASANGWTTKEWYDFFRALLDLAAEGSAQEAQIQDIIVRLAALENESGLEAIIQGVGSVVTFGTLADGIVQITLQGDNATPGNTYYYGTGPDGTKGFFPVSDALVQGDGITLTVGSDGRTTVEHADTSSVTDISANFTGGTVPAEISMTYDQFGHVLTRTITGRTLDHNDTGAIQGGSATERYHQTAAQNTNSAALSAMGTGIAVKTGTSTWAARSLPNGTGYTWTNGTGVSGNPTLVLSANLQSWSATAPTNFVNTTGNQTGIAGNKSWTGTHTITGTGAGSAGSGLLIQNSSFDSKLVLERTGTTGNVSIDFVSPGGVVRAGLAAASTQTFAIGAVGDTLNAANTFFRSNEIETLIGRINNETSDTYRAEMRSRGYANVDVLGDIDNTAGEPGGASLLLSVDAGVTGAILGVTQSDGGDGRGGTVTGTLANSTVLSTVGNANMFFGTNRVARWRLSNVGNLVPAVDNTYTLGVASLRPTELYAVNGSINTSDANLKTEPRYLTAAEIEAAKEVARLPMVWKWLQAVEEKGENARLHCGPTVQAVMAIMQAHGIDPFRWGAICYDEWPEEPEEVVTWEAEDEVLETWDDEYDDEGELIRAAGSSVITPAREAGSRVISEYRPAGNCYSLRKDELTWFVLAGMAAAHDALEARVTALEG